MAIKTHSVDASAALPVAAARIRQRPRHAIEHHRRLNDHIANDETRNANANAKLNLAQATRWASVTREIGGFESRFGSKEAGKQAPARGCARWLPFS
jgi:hypothetical protein